MADEHIIRTVRFPRELFERIEEARGRMAREAWIRDACELALQTMPTLPKPVPGPNVENIVSSQRAKRDVIPIPKLDQ